jgi:putative transposase
MDTYPPSDSKTSDTDARIDAQTPTADHPNDTGTPGALTPADSTNGPFEPPRSFALEAEGTANDLDDVVTAVTTIAQSWCEHATDYADIETLVCQLPINQCSFAAYDAFAPYTGPYPMTLLVRAFIVEEINDWDETALHDHLRANPALRRDLGFETLPNQSTFWRAWNHRFSDELCAAVQECADAIVRAARTCRVSLPERITADDADEPQTDDRPEHQLLAETTDEVWQQAKPFVCDAFALDRGPNWQIHQNVFWEQHAYMGMREDMYAASGPGSFVLDTTRERVPSGSTHRYQIGKLSVDEIRSMLRNTTQMLIARARQHGELGGKLWTAIDVIKGVPFTGDVDDNDNDILGYKDGNQYYQWAVLKIVGMDVPLVLDAIPRKRGQSKHEIVEQLLTQTTEMATLDLVMMDREFDSEGVKETCEAYGVHYLNPTRIFTKSDETETIAWMYRNGKRFHVTEEETDDDTTTQATVPPEAVAVG